jgi:cysteine desulfurase / selenocysteine lyase
VSSDPIDIVRARRDTPASERVLHFNNAGASLMPEPVHRAVVEHLALEADIGGYEAAEQAHERIERVYGAAAELIGADPDEIAFTENATRAWDLAFHSLPFRPGDRILTAQAEYASNFIAYLQVARRSGAVVEVVPDDEHGQLDVAALRRMMDERVRLISITHVPTNGGLVNPAAEVGRVAREAGALFLLDACQSVGQLPLDVEEIGCDFLSATGRKYLRGPRGTGFLYVRRAAMERMEPVFLDLHAAEWVEANRYRMRPDARRFETWEQNVAGKIGLAVAIDYARQWGMPAIWSHVAALGELLRAELRRVPGVSVEDLGRVRGGIVTFQMEGRDPAEIRARLAAERIHVSVSDPSSTLLDMRARGIEGLVRASVHYYNTEQEVERFCSVLRGLAHG